MSLPSSPSILPWKIAQQINKTLAAPALVHFDIYTKLQIALANVDPSFYFSRETSHTGRLRGIIVVSDGNGFAFVPFEAIDKSRIDDPNYIVGYVYDITPNQGGASKAARGGGFAGSLAPHQPHRQAQGGRPQALEERQGRLCHRRQAHRQGRRWVKEGPVREGLKMGNPL